MPRAPSGEPGRYSNPLLWFDDLLGSTHHIDACAHARSKRRCDEGQHAVVTGVDAECLGSPVEAG